MAAGNASANLERAATPPLETLQEHFNKICTENCSQEWFRCAKEVLVNNGYNTYAYDNAVQIRLNKSKQKGDNIIAVGRTNYRKSFLLDLLELIFKTFTCITSASYA